MAEDRYLHGHHESVLRSHRWRTVGNSAAYLRPHLRPGQSVLDVGSGPGTLTCDLAAIVAPGQVTALETSPDALALTMDEARRRGVSVHGVVGDVLSLAFRAGYDVVHAHQVLQHLTDPVRALRNMERVCKPGGIVAARDADYGGFTWWPANAALDRWLDVYREAARAAGGEPDAGRRLLGWAHAAGLRDVAATASVWCFASAEDREWWGLSWADRVLASRFAKQAMAVGATQAELREMAEGWRTWAAHEDGWFLVPHAEIVACV